MSQYQGGTSHHKQFDGDKLWLLLWLQVCLLSTKYLSTEYSVFKVKLAHKMVKVPCIKYVLCTTGKHPLPSAKTRCLCFHLCLWMCSSELRLRRSELPFIDLHFNRTCLLGCQVSDSRKFLWIGTLSGAATYLFKRGTCL